MKTRNRAAVYWLLFASLVATGAAGCAPKTDSASSSAAPAAGRAPARPSAEVIQTLPPQEQARARHLMGQQGGAAPAGAAR